MTPNDRHDILDRFHRSLVDRLVARIGTGDPNVISDVAGELADQMLARTSDQTHPSDPLTPNPEGTNP